MATLCARQVKFTVYLKGGLERFLALCSAFGDAVKKGLRFMRTHNFICIPQAQLLALSQLGLSAAVFAFLECGHTFVQGWRAK